MSLQNRKKTPSTDAEPEATNPGPVTLCIHLAQSAVCFGHVIDHMTRSKVNLHEHNDED